MHTLKAMLISIPSQRHENHQGRVSATSVQASRAYVYKGPFYGLPTSGAASANLIKDKERKPYRADPKKRPHPADG